VLVIDGVAQTAPRRATLALLAVDGAEPWGRAQAVPPAGDLRAPRDALLAACDRVVAIGDAPKDAAIDDSPGDAVAVGDAQAIFARVVSHGAWHGGRLHPWSSLASGRWGLLTALSRPDRVVRGLLRRGISLKSLVCARDHGPFDRRALEACARAQKAGVDGWLMTPKCALHLPPGFPAPVATLDHGLALSAALRSHLERLIWGAHPPTALPAVP
jgi:tetraacyldisaccharide-1-P 4'-kinase